MRSFVIGFSQKYLQIPVELYGKLSHLVKPSDKVKSPTQDQVPDGASSDSWTEVRHHGHSKSKPAPLLRSEVQLEPGAQAQPTFQPQLLHQPRPLPQSQSQSRSIKRQVQSQLPQQPSDAPNRPNLKIRLAKDTSGEWSPAGSHFVTGLAQPAVSAVNVVGSFLQGIRASFRHDNVVSGQEIHSKKSNENGK